MRLTESTGQVYAERRRTGPDPILLIAPSKPPRVKQYDELVPLDPRGLHSLA